MKRGRWLAARAGWFRGGRVVDLAAGHGLLAHILLLLDDSSRSALAVDRQLPPSAMKLHDALQETWPKLDRRVEFLSRGLDEVALDPDDLVVSRHACGALTDVILARAAAAKARVAVCRAVITSRPPTHGS